MAGLFDTGGGSLFSGGYNMPVDGMNAMLTPQDRWMSLFAGLSKAGERMARPGMGGVRGFAAGLGGIGEGISEANQQALVQKLLGIKFAGAKQELDDKRMLGDIFSGTSTTPGATPTSAAGMPPASPGTAASSGDSARADMLKNPALQGAMLRLYGPQGLAALRVEDKPAETKEVYDEKSGQKVIRQWNPTTKRYDIPVGGAQIDPEKLQLQADGTWGYGKGVVPALAGKEGSLVTAKEKAGLPFVGPKAMAAVPAAIAEAAGKAPITVATENAKNYTLSPDAVRMPGQPLAGMIPGYPGIPAGVPRVGQPPAAAARPPQADPLANASPEDLQRIANDPTYPADPAMRDAAKKRLSATAQALSGQVEGQTPIATNPDKGRLGTIEDKLRGDFAQHPNVKAALETRPIIASMRDAMKNTSKASDLNLVYGLAKIFDPTSVVREGEMIMVKNTASLPDWVVGQINGLNGGAALQPDTRKAIMTEAESRVKAYETLHDEQADRFRSIATARGANPDNVIAARKAELPTEGYAENTIITGPDGAQKILRAGKWVDLK